MAVRSPRSAGADRRVAARSGRRRRRLQVGTRPAPVRLVDLATALEAALLGAERETEGLTLRLRSRTSALLATDDDPARGLFDDVGLLYGLRSKLVHGGQIKRKGALAKSRLTWWSGRRKRSRGAVPHCGSNCAAAAFAWWRKTARTSPWSSSAPNGCARSVLTVACSKGASVAHNGIPPASWRPGTAPGPETKNPCAVLCGGLIPAPLTPGVG